MIKHILVPVDLEASDVSAKAMRWAVAFARPSAARITVMTVLPAWPHDLDTGPRNCHPRLDDFIATHGAGADLAGEIKIGGAVSARIIEAAQERDIDLIVMASHDPRMSDYLIGSNAAHVTLHVPCSVMVVR